MKTYALVRAGQVENVILAEQSFIELRGDQITAGGECIELDEAKHVDGQRPGPGWTMTTTKAGARKFARPAGA